MVRDGDGDGDEDGDGDGGASRPDTRDTLGRLLRRVGAGRRCGGRAHMQRRREEKVVEVRDGAVKGDKEGRGTITRKNRAMQGM